MDNSYSIRTAWILSVLVLLGGCAGGPVSYGIKGEAASQLNPDAAGKPLSVVVRVYQLKQPTEFSKLTFDVLAAGRPESELLGSDLIEKSEHVMVPGTELTATEKLSENATFVGIVALFRQPDAHLWRHLVAADQIRSKGLTFKLQDCYITLVGIKSEPIPGRPENPAPNCEPPQAAIQPAPSAASQSTAAPSPPKPQAATRKPSRTKRAINAGKQLADPAWPSAPAPSPGPGATTNLSR